MSNTRKQRSGGFAYSAISTRIVQYLYGQGMTLKEIGALMDLKESFISRVRKGDRSLTLEHLTKLEQALGKPLPVILAHATPVDSVPKEMQPVYAAFHGFLATLSQK